MSIEKGLNTPTLHRSAMSIEKGLNTHPALQWSAMSIEKGLNTHPALHRSAMCRKSRTAPLEQRGFCFVRCVLT